MKPPTIWKSRIRKFVKLNSCFYNENGDIFRCSSSQDEEWVVANDGSLGTCVFKEDCFLLLTLSIGFLIAYFLTFFIASLLNLKTDDQNQVIKERAIDVDETFWGELVSLFDKL